MAQEAVTPEVSGPTQGYERSEGRRLLGPILCWGVVFTGIGSTVFYFPEIFFGTVHLSPGYFALLIMPVFLLLVLKYREVAIRFPQGGGAATVAAYSLNRWLGALAGIWLLVSYILIIAISCLTSIRYLGTIIPAVNQPFSTNMLSIGIITLLFILNWSAKIIDIAKITLVAAVVAFISNIAILFTVFTHIPLSQFLSFFHAIFVSKSLPPTSLLIGFAGSFLAISGLESITYLSPNMKTPRSKVAGFALFIVTLTISITYPLLTLLSTTLFAKSIFGNPTLSPLAVPLLGGHWGNAILQMEVTIIASVLLILASNVAVVGASNVISALARMEFFPTFVLKRNKLRGTQHYSIALITGVSILVILLVQGNIIPLASVYIVSFLGALILLCLGLDIIRNRERKAARVIALHLLSTTELTQEYVHANGPASVSGLDPKTIAMLASPARNWRMRLRDLWYNLDFWLGILTTFLVALAWTTIFVANLHAAALSCAVVSVGMLVAYINYAQYKRLGRLPVAVAPYQAEDVEWSILGYSMSMGDIYSYGSVAASPDEVLPKVTTGVEGRLPGSILAVLTPHNPHNDAVIRSAISNADGNPVVFLFVGEPRAERIPQIFEVNDPYLDDQEAKKFFGKAENLARQSNINSRFVYRQQEPEAIASVWQVVQPRVLITNAETVGEVLDINADRIRYESTPNGKVAHLIKRW